MPLTAVPQKPFKPNKEILARYNTWRKGLNTLLLETEIDGSECTQATNMLLVGSGIPTKRWGSANSFLAGATGYGRMILPIKDPNDNIQVLAMTDQGVLTKQNGASYTIITGTSWSSGYNLEGTILGGKVYFMNGQQPLARYDFTTLISFPTGIGKPTGLTASNFSGATGLTTWSWIVTSVSRVGETAGTTAVSLASLPQNIASTEVVLNWTGVSAASGDLLGYNIYRGIPGAEVYVGGVSKNSTSFFDTGNTPPDPYRTAPTADTSGGPTAKYIMRWQDRLILAGIPGDPTKVLISGRLPLNERFDWQAQGGFIKIEPDSGQDIMGLGTYYIGTTQTILVFKEKSVWEIQLTTFNSNVGGIPYTILNPLYRLLTASQGCSSFRSIQAVENDIMFTNRRGIFILRYEPQLIQVINANEISAKIRPFFLALTNADHQAATAIYADKKYIVHYPSIKSSIMFDRERLSFMGPWITPFSINHWGQYVDSSGVEHWLVADASDSYISEFRTTYPDDGGTAFTTIFKTKKEDFGDWSLFKTINTLYMLFRNIQGTVNVNLYLEQRTGGTITAKSFSIKQSTGVSGFGTELFGLTNFGLSNQNATLSTVDTPTKTYVYKTARTVQVEIKTTNSLDSYMLLNILTSGINQSRDNAPAAWLTT